MKHRYILNWNFSTLENNKKYTQSKSFIDLTTLNAFLLSSEGCYKIYNYEIIDKEQEQKQDSQKYNIFNFGGYFMNSNKFWNMLSEDSKYKVKEMLSDYSGSDCVIGRIFELFEEASILADCTVEEYLAELSPDEYVDYCYEGFLERKDYYELN